MSIVSLVPTRNVNHPRVFSPARPRIAVRADRSRNAESPVVNLTSPAKPKKPRRVRLLNRIEHQAFSVTVEDAVAARGMSEFPCLPNHATARVYVWAGALGEHHPVQSHAEHEHTLGRPAAHRPPVDSRGRRDKKQGRSAHLSLLRGLKHLGPRAISRRPRRIQLPALALIATIPHRGTIPSDSPSPSLSLFLSPLSHAHAFTTPPIPRLAHSLAS